MRRRFRVLPTSHTRPRYLRPSTGSSQGNLINHGQLGFDGRPTTGYEPLYPLFLAVSRTLTLDRVLLVQALQALVAAAGAVWMYLLTDALTRRTAVGLVAAGLYAVDPMLVRHAVSPGEFALMATLLCAFAYTFVTTATPARAAAAGLWLGLAILTRTMALPIAILAAAVLALDGRRQAALVVMVTALALVSLLGIRNYRINGVLLPSRSGINLFIGNSEYAAALIPEHSPDILQEYAAARARLHGLTISAAGLEDDSAADALFTRLAIDELKKRPREVLWLKVRNVAYFFWPRLVPAYVLTRDTTITLQPGGRFRIDGSPARPRIEHIVYTASYVLLVPAAVIGIWRRGRDIRRDLILWCIMATFVAASVLYFPATRYRAPTEFVLLFYAAIGMRLTRDDPPGQSCALPES